MDDTAEPQADATVVATDPDGSDTVKTDAAPQAGAAGSDGSNPMVPAPEPVTLDQVDKAIADAMAGLADHLPELVRGAAAATLPQLLNQAMGAHKDWVRRELDLMQAGHSRQTREAENE